MKGLPLTFSLNDTGLQLDLFTPLFEKLERLGLFVVENNRTENNPPGLPFSQRHP